MKARHLLPALLLAGCATVPDGPVGGELVGRTLTVQAQNGAVTNLLLHGDGRVTASFDGRSTQGRWETEEGRLCFTWSGNFRECWPYNRPFRRGDTVSITSDRGNVVRVTLR